MAVAVPRRRTAPAPPPARTSPPKRKAPAGKPARGAAAAPARTAPARKAPARTAPARKAPQRRNAAAAPARRAPARKPAPRRAQPGRRLVATGQLIPLAVGRTAVAVRGLPDSGLMVRMTRGRAWIAVLGILLVGIVALNVVTLSFAASAGKIDEQITALEEENSMLSGRVAHRYGAARVRSEAAAQGLVMPSTEEPKVIEAGPNDVATAAARLAAAGG